MPAAYLRTIDAPSAADPAMTVATVIIGAIQSGATHEDAALFAGVAPSTLSVWLTRGMDEITRLATDNIDEPSPTEESYANLAFEVARADAVSRVGITADWRRHIGRDWRAADRFMAKRYGGIWADQQGGPIVVGGGSSLTLQLSPMSHGEAQQLEAELKSRRAELAALEAGQPADA